MLAVTLLLCRTPAQSDAAPPEPLQVEERVVLRVPEDLPGKPAGCAISPDGARALCILSTADERSALFGAEFGQDGPGLSEAHRFVSTPQFSADGKHLAWAWGDAKGQQREAWEIWLDGKRLKAWDWIGAYAFSAGGELAYQAAEGAVIGKEGWYQGGDYYLVRGKKKSDQYGDFGPFPPLWSPDGKRLAFIATKLSGNFVVVEGKEHGPYPWVQSACWLDDGKTMAWSAFNSQGQARIVVGKKEYGEERESVGAPAAGGGSLAYLYAARNRRGLIFRDEVVPGLYDDLGTPAVSRDGARVAVAGARGREQVEAGWIMVDPSWMDGAIVWGEDSEDADEGEGSETKDPPPAREPAAEPDSQGGALGYLGGALGGGAAATEKPKSACFLLVDGKPVGAEWMRVVRPFFSPDSQRVAARVRSKQGWHMQLDERATAAYDEVLAPRFAADGALEFGARRGRELLFVRVPAAP